MLKSRNVKVVYDWAFTAISNAKYIDRLVDNDIPYRWTGVRLRDVLEAAGITENDPTIKHIHLEGADVDETGTHYSTSITKEKVRCEQYKTQHCMIYKNKTHFPGVPL